MKVKLIRHTCEPEMLAGYAAAKCYNGKDPRKSLEIAMDGGHESVLEHAVFTFEVDEVSRVLLAQITRHRLASFSVQSQRYCGANQNVVTPDSMVHPELLGDIVAVKKAVDRLYKHARELGVPHEDNAYPVVVYAKFYVAANKYWFFMSTDLCTLFLLVIVAVIIAAFAGNQHIRNCGQHRQIAGLLNIFFSTDSGIKDFL
jgi:flavin-dependent thymidylate synthase